jgi:hypothetical protein
MRHGAIGDHRLLVRNYAPNMPGIQEWQLRRLEGYDECSLAAPGDKMWGFELHRGTYVEICRCERRECSHYAECRPDGG